MDDPTWRGGRDKHVPPRSGPDKQVPPGVEGARLSCPLKRADINPSMKRGIWRPVRDPGYLLVTLNSNVFLFASFVASTLAVSVLLTLYWGGMMLTLVASA